MKWFFIAYHQINELLFKLILWELNQLAEKQDLTAAFFEEKTKTSKPLFRHVDHLFYHHERRDGSQAVRTNFAILWLQLVAFKVSNIDILSWPQPNLLILLICVTAIPLTEIHLTSTPFEHMYWQAAGKDFETGKKSILLKDFEDRYKEDLLDFMSAHNTKNVWTLYKSMPDKVKQNQELIDAMRHYDYTVNVTWVLAHYNTAKHYIEG